jgi:APA family basic amino acid/polyamine antiporter
VATGTFRALFTRVVYTEWLFFGLLAIGMILLRRRADLTRQYSMRGAPLLPIVFALSSFAIVVSTVRSQPRDALIGLALVVAGLPIYLLWTSRRKDFRPSALDLRP